MGEVLELNTVDNIINSIYIIRGQQVMLDSDLAKIYGYEVKRLNEQVKRNIKRFPEDFMFQLTREEIDFVKSQFATSRITSLFEGQEGGRRKLPYVFTEQGIYMLATVLKGELAEQQSIFIMRAFKEMRHYIRQNRQFVTQSEMNLVTAKVSEFVVPCKKKLHETTGCHTGCIYHNKRGCIMRNLSLEPMPSSRCRMGRF